MKKIISRMLNSISDFFNTIIDKEIERVSEFYKRIFDSNLKEGR